MKYPTEIYGSFEKRENLYQTWSNLKLLEFNSAPAMEVVVAQVVERWHSVWAGRVQTLAFFQVRIAVNLFSLGVKLFLIMCNRTVHTLPSSFQFPFIIYHCENYQFQAKNVQRKIKK